MWLLQSIDRDAPAIYPVCARRGDEGDDVGHFLGGAEPAHREAVANVIVEIVSIGDAVAIPAIAVEGMPSLAVEMSPATPPSLEKLAAF